MGDVLRPDADEAAAEWARRVRANREQVDRFRETADGPDFYGPIAAAFRADPRRTNEPLLDVLRSLVAPGDSWLDIGAGGGRYALPIALLCSRVTAVDPSDGMLAMLREGMAEHGIANVSVVQSRWPTEEPIEADVALIANVGMDIEAFAAFLDAMEASARRLCVAVFPERQPTFVFDQLWPAVHGEPRATLPALAELLALLLARGRMFEVRLTPRGGMSYERPEDFMGMVRRQLWTKPGSEKDQAAERMVRSQLSEREGRWALSWEPQRIGIVTWAPR